MAIYKIGLAVVTLYAVLWSFVLDKNKPDSSKELVAKLIARCLFLVFIFSVLVGFAYFALDVFNPPN